MSIGLIRHYASYSWRGAAVVLVTDALVTNTAQQPAHHKLRY